jgi:hypothetical protein
MLQTIDTTREGFLCPQCHQDMSNMEMLQLHFQTVHMKQPGKGNCTIKYIRYMKLYLFRFYFLCKTKTEKCSREF